MRSSSHVSGTEGSRPPRLFRLGLKPLVLTSLNGSSHTLQLPRMGPRIVVPPHILRRLCCRQNILHMEIVCVWSSEGGHRGKKHMDHPLRNRVPQETQ